MSTSSNEIEMAPPEFSPAAETAHESHDSLVPQVPQQSKEKYFVAYNNFMKWKIKKNATSFSESVFLAYFSEIAHKFKPSTLWCIFSMLKTTVMSKHGINIQNYTKLTTCLKKLSKGFQPKQSKVLTAEQIEQFLYEAPDEKYLAAKVALIFGITGACKTHELLDITMDDIEEHNQLLLVRLRKTRTKTPRSFIIEGEFYDKVKKYIASRPENIETKRLFLNYHDEKCTRQVIGKNKFGNMPKTIAKFLNLPDANEYTGHAFRRSSATLLANLGAHIAVLQRHGGWKSFNMAQGYAKDSIKNKGIGGQFTESLNLRPITSTPLNVPSTSRISNEHGTEYDENACRDWKSNTERNASNDDSQDLTNIDLLLGLVKEGPPQVNHTAIDFNNITESDPMTSDVSRDEDSQGEVSAFAQVNGHSHDDSSSGNQTTEILSRLTAIESSRREMDQRQTAALEAISAALQRQAAAAERQVDVMIKMVELVEQRVQRDG